MGSLEHVAATIACSQVGCDGYISGLVVVGEAVISREVPPKLTFVIISGPG